jgi:hypothetical protein
MHLDEVLDYAREHLADDDLPEEVIVMLLEHSGTARIAHSPMMLDMLHFHHERQDFEGLEGILRDFSI